MAFIGELKFERMAHLGESFVGRPLYVLTEPIAYRNHLVKDDFIVECEVGFITDFASIPEYLFF